MKKLQRNGDDQIKILQELKANDDGLRNGIESIQKENRRIHREIEDFKRLNNLVLSKLDTMDKTDEEILNQLELLKYSDEMIKDEIKKFGNNDEEIIASIKQLMKKEKEISKKVDIIVNNLKKIKDNQRQLQRNQDKMLKAIYTLSSDVTANYSNLTAQNQATFRKVIQLGIMQNITATTIDELGRQAEKNAQKVFDKHKKSDIISEYSKSVYKIRHLIKDYSILTRLVGVNESKPFFFAHGISTEDFEEATDKLHEDINLVFDLLKGTGTLSSTVYEALGCEAEYTELFILLANQGIAYYETGLKLKQEWEKKKR